VVLLAAAAAQFGRDLDFDLDRVASIVAAARRAGAGLLVLPDGTLGGYLNDLREPRVTPEPDAVGSDVVGGGAAVLAAAGTDELPPALAADDPVVRPARRPGR